MISNNKSKVVDNLKSMKINANCFANKGNKPFLF